MDPGLSLFPSRTKSFFIDFHAKLAVLTRSIKDFLGLSRKIETIFPQFILGSSILRRATSQSVNPEQYFSKYLPADSHLGHLKGDVPAVSDNLRTDLNQFRKQSAQ